SSPALLSCASIVTTPSCVLTRPAPSSTLSPYTTLFRSSTERQNWARPLRRTSARPGARPNRLSNCRILSSAREPVRSSARTRRRSEEHTSELQSRFDLVCRLLLEKKKQINNCTIIERL